MTGQQNCPVVPAYDCLMIREINHCPWSQCTDSQPVDDFLSHHPAVGCHYFPPGLRSPVQAKNITILWPVPSYTAWWQRHIGVNNLPKVVMQLCPAGNWTHDLLIASSVPYHYAFVPPHMYNILTSAFILLLVKRYFAHLLSQLHCKAGAHFCVVLLYYEMSCRI